MSKPHIDEVREHLLATLTALRDKENPMEVERAKALAHVASVLVDTAKVENEYLKISGNFNSQFLEPSTDEKYDDKTPMLTTPPSPFPTGVTVTRHVLKG